jgi:hypothetical protein
MCRWLMIRLMITIWAASFAATVCLAQSGDIHVPSTVLAGSDAAVSTNGTGKATFYLVGPGVSHKEDVSLGSEIHLRSQDLHNAGSYLAIVCSDICRGTTFFVIPSQPASLTFLVHPSRVPVSQGDSVSGVVFPFDQFHNQVFAPVSVGFQLSAGKASLFSRAARTQNGVAWFRTTSGRSAGALQVVATLDNLSTRRVVQQVASDPCNLRINGQRTNAGIVVQTEPVHDCAGNPVPDGTIVSFTATEAIGKSTVDAPIKQGVARALISPLAEASGGAIISAASGVVMGNEVRVGAQP